MIKRKITKEKIFLAIIFIIGFYVRFKYVQLNAGFDGEVGDNLLDIKNAYLAHQIPLHGAPTSHPWLYFPPLFYWIYGSILILSNFNPLSHSYYGATISFLTLIALYIFCKKIFNEKVGIIASLLTAFAPLFLSASIIGRFIYTVPLFALLFYLLLIQVTEGKKKNLIWLFFTLGILLNFHYSTLFFIPVIFTVIYIKRISFSIKEWITSLFAFLIPVSPLLIFDSKNHFSMLKNFFLWIPYRIAGFFGLYHKNTVSVRVLEENNQSLLQFFSSSFFPHFNAIGIIIALLTIGYILFLLFKAIKQRSTTNALLVLFSCLIWGIIATSIHGNPPAHYYVPLFPLPIIFFSLFLTSLTAQWMKKLITILLSFLCLYNFLFAFNLNLIKNHVTYATKQKIAHYIVQNAHGEKYTLQRIGYNDFYTKNFAQNYIYLLWWYGNEPVEKAALTYIIVEDKNRMPKIQNAQTIKIIDNGEIIKVKNRG